MLSESKARRCFQAYSSPTTTKAPHPQEVAAIFHEGGAAAMPRPSFESGQTTPLTYM